MQGLGVIMFAFLSLVSDLPLMPSVEMTHQLESTLETDPDEKLEVMRMSGNKRENLLCNSEFLDASFLVFRNQAEKCHDLLTEQFRFSRVRETYLW